MNNFYRLCAYTLSETQLSTPLTPPIDWENIIDAAGAYSMTQIIFGGIDKAGLNPYAVPNYALLQEQSEEDGHLQIRLEGQCRNIIHALVNDNVTFVPVGGFLSKLAYPSTQLRFLQEFEICVPEINAADNTLLAMGYSIKEAFTDRKYFVKDDSITVAVIAQGVSPEGEFADIYGYSSVIRAEDCVSTHIFDVSCLIPTQEKALEYMFKYAAQAFVCGGLSPLEVWDILLFVHSFNPDKNKLFELLRAAGLVRFASAIFTVGAKYFGKEFENYFVTDSLITPEMTEDFCIDTLSADIHWDTWTNVRQIRVPYKISHSSAMRRFFTTFGSKALAQPLNLDKERLPLLSALGVI